MTSSLSIRSHVITTLMAMLTLPGCGKDLAIIFTSPSVEQRVSQSLTDAAAPVVVTPANSEDFRFAVFSDVHAGPSNATTLHCLTADVQRRDISFFIVLGDLSEDGSDEEFRAVRADLDNVGIPYYVAVGNHDLFQSDETGGWDKWVHNFGPSTYTVNIAGVVRLVLLDTSSGDIGSRQFAWLQRTLATPAPHTIVGTHYPIADGIVPTIWRLSSIDERMQLVSLLNRYHVDAYVAGHMHGFMAGRVGEVPHFIVGSMYPHRLDEGPRGYLLFHYDHGTLNSERVGITYP